MGEMRNVYRNCHWKAKEKKKREDADIDDRIILTRSSGKN
jgi:hypothetical protein